MGAKDLKEPQELKVAPRKLKMYFQPGDTVKYPKGPHGKLWTVIGTWAAGEQVLVELAGKGGSTQLCDQENCTKVEMVEKPRRR